jgi:hypothetical protein
VAAGEQEPTAALLDQTARQPAQQEELARIRVANLGVAKEDPTVALRHFCFEPFFFGSRVFVLFFIFIFQVKILFLCNFFFQLIWRRNFLR